jgi:peroxiredoxin/outer membrane lipoprotein-sorting protein
MHRSAFAALASVGLLAGSDLALATTTEELLRSTARHYQDVTSYEFAGRLSMSVMAGSQSQTVESTVRLAGMRPDLFRETIEGGQMTRTTVANPAGTWTYLPSRNQYLEQPAGGTGMKSNALSLSRFEDLAKHAPRAEDLGREAVTLADGEERECHKVSLPASAFDAASPGMAPTEYTVWIDTTTELVAQELAVVKGDRHPQLGVPVEMTIKVTYDETHLDPEFEARDFTFVPPDGATRFDPNQGAPAEPPSKFVGEPASTIALSTLSGDEVSLESLKGKVVLIDFWATWCGPCRMELPHIQKIYDDLKEEGLEVLAISNEREATVRRFIEKEGYSFPVLLDAGKSVTRAYDVSALPTLFIIDREGVIRSHLVGLRPEGVLRQALADAGL